MRRDVDSVKLWNAPALRRTCGACSVRWSLINRRKKRSQRSYSPFSRAGHRFHLHNPEIRARLWSKALLSLCAIWRRELYPELHIICMRLIALLQSSRLLLEERITALWNCVNILFRIVGFSIKIPGSDTRSCFSRCASKLFHFPGKAGILKLALVPAFHPQPFALCLLQILGIQRFIYIYFGFQSGSNFCSGSGRRLRGIGWSSWYLSIQLVQIFHRYLSFFSLWIISHVQIMEPIWRFGQRVSWQAWHCCYVIIKNKLKY